MKKIRFFLIIFITILLLLVLYFISKKEKPIVSEQELLENANGFFSDIEFFLLFKNNDISGKISFIGEEEERKTEGTWSGVIRQEENILASEFSLQISQKSQQIADDVDFSFSGKMRYQDKNIFINADQISLFLGTGNRKNRFYDVFLSGLQNQWIAIPLKEENIAPREGFLKEASLKNGLPLFQEKLKNTDLAPFLEIVYREYTKELKENILFTKWKGENAGVPYIVYGEFGMMSFSGSLYKDKEPLGRCKYTKREKKKRGECSYKEKLFTIESKQHGNKNKREASYRDTKKKYHFSGEREKKEKSSLQGKLNNYTPIQSYLDTSF